MSWLQPSLRWGAGGGASPGRCSSARRSCSAANRTARSACAAQRSSSRPNRVCTHPLVASGVPITRLPSRSTAISSSPASQISNVLSPAVSSNSARTWSQTARSAVPAAASRSRTAARSTVTRRLRLRPRPVRYVSSSRSSSATLPPSGGPGGSTVLGFWGSLPARALGAGVSAGVFAGVSPESVRSAPPFPTETPALTGRFWGGSARSAPPFRRETPALTGRFWPEPVRCWPAFPPATGRCSSTRRARPPRRSTASAATDCTLATNGRCPAGGGTRRRLTRSTSPTRDLGSGISQQFVLPLPPVPPRRTSSPEASSAARARRYVRSGHTSRGAEPLRRDALDDPLARRRAPPSRPAAAGRCPGSGCSSAPPRATPR